MKIGEYAVDAFSNEGLCNGFLILDCYAAGVGNSLLLQNLRSKLFWRSFTGLSN